MSVKRANWHGRKCPVPKDRNVEIDGKLFRASSVGYTVYAGWSGIKFAEYGKWWICRFIVQKVK